MDHSTVDPQHPLSILKAAWRDNCSTILLYRLGKRPART